MTLRNWIAEHGWATFWIVVGLIALIDAVCGGIAVMIHGKGPSDVAKRSEPQ